MFEFDELMIRIPIETSILFLGQTEFAFKKSQ